MYLQICEKINTVVQIYRLQIETTRLNYHTAPSKKNRYSVLSLNICYFRICGHLYQNIPTFFTRWRQTIDYLLVLLYGSVLMKIQIHVQRILFK